MRSIDADKLKKKIELLCKDERNLISMTAITYFALLELVDTMPTIEVEPDKDWISVKDKLPDEGENVLIYCPEFLEDIRKAFYTEGDFFIEKEDLIVRPAPNGYCTHWRHLPKPPKGE